MKKRRMALVGILSMLGFGLYGCGGGSSGTTSTSLQSPNGSPGVAVFAGDSPICDVVSFTVTITGATATPKGGGTPVPIISSPVTVDFAALMDFTTLLNLASVPAGTYNKVTLMLSMPKLTVLQFTSGKLTPTAIATTLTTSSVTVDIDPPLTVSSSGTAGLNFDFQLRKSVQTDSSGQVTGTVNPVFRASANHPIDEGEGREGMGEIDDLEGVVQSVSTTSSNSSFVGSFVIQSEGKTFTVQVTSKTEFEGVLGLTGLTAGKFVEVEAFVDSSSNIVAKEVEVEEQEEQQKAAFVGLITSVTRNGSGQVTQFNLFIRREEPDESSCVPPHTLLNVTLSSSTTFKIAAKGVNFASLTLDSTALGQGQEVVVHGTCQTGASPTLAANAVVLKLQTILGNFSARLAVASDGKTGGFSFVPCGVVFSGSGLITALTSAQTAFAGVADLNGLTPTPELAVKGLLFYKINSLTVNGVSVTGSATAPVPVLVAKQVHQLP